MESCRLRLRFRSRLATRKIFLVGAMIGALHGCATKAPPRVVAVARPAAPPREAPARLAVLPSDRLLYPEIAIALDQQLDRAHVAGTEPMSKANVSMEVAQLALECVSASDDCYTQVGRFLQVDRLLWGQIVRDPQTNGVTVSVVLLDVGRGAALSRTEETFPKSEIAIQGLRGLVDKATGAPSPSTPATPATAGKPALPVTPAAPAAAATLSQKERTP
jgi:hypothetical protein